MTKEAAQRQLLTPKQMAKTMKREGVWYLDVVLPNKVAELQKQETSMSAMPAATWKAAAINDSNGKSVSEV